MNPCTTDKCPQILDSSCVFYEGATLLFSGINTNDSVEVVIQKLNLKLESIPIFNSNNYYTKSETFSQTEINNLLSTKQNNLGYTPENIANKSDSYIISSSTTYSSTKALVDGLSTKLDKGTYTRTAQDLKNEIDSKANVSHTHDISSITNLQNSLDTITNGINNLEGINYIWSPTNRTLTLFDGAGTQLSQVSLVSLDNEGTDIRYNASTLSLELWNADNELLDSIPVSSFIGSVGTQLQLNSNQLQLKDSQGNILSTVGFEISNINGLQTTLDNKQDKLSSYDESVLIEEGGNIEGNVSLFQEYFEQQECELNFTPIQIIGVYVNGIKQKPSSYTITLPKTITITNFTSGDYIEIQYTKLKN